MQYRRIASGPAQATLRANSSVNEIEITEIPPLKPNEQSLLEMHSLLNVFNVLRSELVLIGLALADDDALLKRGLALCDRMADGLRNGSAKLAAARDVDEHTRLVLAEIDGALNGRAEVRQDHEVVKSLDNLQSVFATLRVHARELLARAHDPESWVVFSAAALQRNLVEVFAAIERNSRQRFRIVYNAALQRPGDYYMDLKIESASGDRLRMPPVFQDVMRDLIANARKYTAPGGHIIAALHSGSDALRFLVEDTGRGIPPDELEAVVRFGYRAKNVSDVRMFGGGFGLTKAFFATKQFGGRFWIASELGRGTRVRLEIPQTRAAAHGR